MRALWTVLGLCIVLMPGADYNQRVDMDDDVRDRLLFIIDADHAGYRDTSSH